MSYSPPPAPPDPYQPASGFPGQPAYAQPPKKSNATKIALIMVGGVVTLCLGMVVIGALMPQQEAPRHAPAVAAPPAPVVPSLPALPDPADSAEGDAGLEASAAAALVKVPDLKGENAAVAADELRKLGFTNIQFGSQDEDDKVVILPSNWTVTKQSAKAGKSLPSDSLIVLTCTKAT